MGCNITIFKMTTPALTAVFIDDSTFSLWHHLIRSNHYQKFLKFSQIHSCLHQILMQALLGLTDNSVVSNPAFTEYFVKSFSMMWYFIILCTGFISRSAIFALGVILSESSAKKVDKWSWINKSERGLLAQYWMYISNFFSYEEKQVLLNLTHPVH